MAVIKITKENFEAEVMKSDKPVLIDFWADWCGPCQMIGPIINEIGEESTTAKICKVDVDSEPELAKAFGVSSIPNLVVVKDGKIANRGVGAMSKEEVLALLD